MPASLWGRVREHKIIQWGLAYFGAALALAHAQELIGHAFHWPDIVGRALIVLLAIGWPVALTFAWYHGHRGLQRVSEGELMITSVLLLIGAVIFTVALRPRAESDASETTAAGEGVGGAPTAALAPPVSPTAPPRKSVAVLTCENLSDEAADEYFAAGIHEEILNQLAKIRDLSVIARASVLKYAETRPTIPEIARELNVATIVECSARYSGQTVRVTAQFIDAVTGTHLWSDTYDRDRSDVFGIQTEIATKIAASLQAELSIQERERIETPPTSSPEAYALYLKGRAAFDGTFATVDAALGYLDDAVELDPSFALAHAWSAYVRVLTLGTILGGPASEDPAVRAEIAARARENAEQALALDPTLGTAHGALGWLLYRDWKWQEGGEAFARAVELGPNEPRHLAALSVYFLGEGRYDDAARLLERAISLDPRTPVWFFALAGVRALDRDFIGSGAALDQGLAVDPSFAPLHSFASQGAITNGDRAKAATEARTVERLLGPNPSAADAGELARLYTLVGLNEDARRMIAYVEAKDLREPVSAQTLAALYFGVGELDKAFAWLDTAIRTHDTYGYYPHLNFRVRNAVNAGLWDDPRYQAARQAFGVTDSQ